MVTTLKRGASEKSIQNALDKLYQNIQSKGVNVKKYCGIIQLKEDPLSYQKRVRSEWK